MLKIVLPKWAVVTGLGNARLIHIGNGEFVSADVHCPKVLETAVPNLTPEDALPVDIKAEEAPGFETMTWDLGSIKVEIPVTETPAEEPAEE